MTRTIITKLTQSVYYNGLGTVGLAGLPIPADIAQLVWNDNTAGYTVDMAGKQTAITAFPAWAQTCVDIYQATLTPPANPLTLQEQASQALYETDWTSIPDITNPAVCTPTLTNQPEFQAYRNQLRVIVLGTQTTGIQLPTRPKAQWSV